MLHTTTAVIAADDVIMTLFFLLYLKGFIISLPGVNIIDKRIPLRELAFS